MRYKDVRRMPPDGKLSDRQIEVLERWVKLGVPWPGAQEVLPRDELECALEVALQLATGGS